MRCACARGRPSGLPASPQQSVTNAMVVSAAFQSAILLSMTVNTAFEVHFNALPSLTQPCLTAYCICCNTSMIQAFYQALQISVSLGKCI